MQYTKLTPLTQRRLFDPSNHKDLLELKYYVTTGKWKNGCPFFQEFPWENIPAMCKDKYTSFQLSNLK